MPHEMLYDQILERRPIHRPWSLAEACTSCFFVELKQWAESLDVYTFDTLVHQQPLRTGTLLLGLHAEVTRRYGHEGQLWAVLSNRKIVCWQPQTWGRLYNPGGNLQFGHRQLLERTALWLELRHAFDVEDAHKWYRLIHLQIGFTHEDAKSRLKDWLSGQWPPVAVQTLLEERDPGALEFQRMWHRLRQYRLGNVSKAGMKEHLKSCCWVLPEWTEDLLKAALAADLIPLANDEEESISQFYTSPTLKWDGSGLPSFSVELCHLNEIETNSDLEVRVQGKVQARLLKQDAGGFAPDTQGALILGEGAALRSRLDLRLVSVDESLVRQASIVLWDADAEVSLFRPSDGWMVTESQLRTGQAFDLIAARDLKLTPAPSSSTVIGAGYRLHRYEKGWAGLIEATMDDVALWTSAGFGKQPEQLNLDTVRARWMQILDFAGSTSHAWPWKVPLRIDVVDRSWSFAGLRWTRADGKMMNYLSPPTELSLVEGDIARTLTLRVNVRHSTCRTATIPVKLPPPMQGCVRWSTEGKPVIQRGDKTLLISDASRSMWSFLLPERRDDLGNVLSMEERRCSFMEGDVVRGSVRSRAMILPRLGGYGAPAWISEDPYNGVEHTMDVGSRVIDGGVIRQVRVDGETNKVTVTQLSEFDLTERHVLLVWIALPDKRGGIVRVNREQLTVSASGWEFPFPPGGSLLGVALLYEGTRLGNWFSSTRWSDALLLSPPAEPVEMAALLRVWKAPLLQSVGNENHRSNVVAWLHKHWMKVLPVWLASEGFLTAPGMGQTPVPKLDDEWKRVVHALMTDLQPSIRPEQVQCFVDDLAASSSNQKPDDRLGFCLLALADISPLLAAKTLSAALQSPFVSNLKAAGKDVFAKMRAWFPCREETAIELALRHGNRDSEWLRRSIPSLQSLEYENKTLPLSYCRLSGSEEFRKFAFGVWLEQIRQRFHL
ncbi:hypothetical protein [Prosthecobacter dejongeii]|uniref:Uncharacterized protein n=1 Tax=Prosthecobacter dejongeii TaxID=48465 RepID=A0A7W8DNY5_9BACT|nr:hypothetical protein [Prosthecobacter dejongeii]MBB5036752.1 hypothetical protein [Prosthecobacter dejongeii]